MLLLRKNKDKKEMSYLKIKKKITSILAIMLLLPMTLLFSGCTQEDPLQGYKVDLEIWGFSEESDIFDKIISEYKKNNPHISEIKYRKLSIGNYRQDVLDAMASGNGPDIFLISNNWLPSFADKLEPAKESLLNITDLQSQFVDVVSNDFTRDNKVYAVPLTVGSLALYYNKDLFNAAAVSAPPKTWSEFIEDAMRMTKIDENGEIIQSGAAFGTAYNINRSTDIISMLMMQNLVSMVDESKSYARFDQNSVKADGSVSSSGEVALQFYTQFSKVGMPAYSWNSRMHYSIDAFHEGNLAMMINYPWHIQTIKSKNAKLNFGIASLPQINADNPSNYANYWGYAVSKNKISYDMSDANNDLQQKRQLQNNVRTHEAWEFIRFLTMKNSGSIALSNAVTGASGQFPVSMDPAIEYIKNTGQVAARRDILETQKSDPLLGPFAYGNFIAKNWYQANPEQVEGYFAEMIDSVNKGSSSIHDAIVLAASRVSQSMR